tara:strand:+ start:405 stop:1574 length:1170 start_codon:yes stop_codon:yes gene_type:complete
MAIVRRNISTIYGLEARLTSFDQALLKRGEFLGYLTIQEANDKIVAAEGYVPGSHWVSSEAGDVTLAVDVTLPVGKGDVVIVLGTEITSVDSVTVISASLREQVAKIGDMSQLTTTEKETLVGALNEVKSTLEAVNASSVTEEQVSGWIDDAKMALGSNFTVNDLTERDALPDLDDGDRVYVRDVGEGKWATFKPVAFDSETGLVTDWMMLMSQDIMTNAMTADGIKAAYESNEDTNAFTDEAKRKSDAISITRESIDLDKTVQNDELEQDVDATVEGATKVPSVDAVKTFVNGRIASSSAMPFSETLSIVNDQITLTHTPRGGVAGIMNFSTVRWIDSNGVAWDATVAATADPKVFDVLVDEVGQWDGNQVMVQYLYQPTAPVEEPVT